MSEHRSFVAALALALAATSCGGGEDPGVSVDGPEGSPPSSVAGFAAPRALLLSGKSGFVESGGQVGFVIGSAIGAGRARQFFPPYTAPLAVAMPSGTVLYNALRADGRPEIRLADLASESDQLEVADAYSIAVDGSGRLAYVDVTSQADPLRDGGVVTVRSAKGDVPVAWSSGLDRFIVLAWARDRLLVRRARAGGEGGDVVVFDAPTRTRVLAAHSELLALSDDGGVALVGATVGDRSSYELRLVDVGSGATLAHLDSIAGEPLKPIVSATWTGGTIVASGTVRGGTVTAIVVLSAQKATSGWSLALERVAELGREVLVPDDVWLSSDRRAVFALAFPPQKSDGRGVPIVAPLRFVSCSVLDGRCTVEEMRETTDTQVARVRNPSRPGLSESVFSEAF